MTKEANAAYDSSWTFIFAWLLLGISLLISGVRDLYDPAASAWTTWLGFISSAVFLLMAVNGMRLRRRRRESAEPAGAAS
ncbi:hypothetical protein [Streptomonospora litoralis]|uniref:Uncharacterized protein n=1 Tax=Streptomonospora litoralis TaxID=2498135 RepID=A0A4P6Q6V4_9ACTN|nr:hypothetical protein [Streptomonospora litoralis]QBI56413.1 hypothetical protein EKD16_23305 [Streptomonospora litoralis]